VDSLGDLVGCTHQYCVQSMNVFTRNGSCDMAKQRFNCRVTEQDRPLLTHKNAGECVL